jgi:hypothetical protein
MPLRINAGRVIKPPHPAIVPSKPAMTDTTNNRANSSTEKFAKSMGGLVWRLDLAQ